MTIRNHHIIIDPEEENQSILEEIHKMDQSILNQAIFIILFNPIQNQLFTKMGLNKLFFNSSDWPYLTRTESIKNAYDAYNIIKADSNYEVRFKIKNKDYHINTVQWLGIISIVKSFFFIHLIGIDKILKIKNLKELGILSSKKETIEFYQTIFNNIGIVNFSAYYAKAISKKDKKRYPILKLLYALAKLSYIKIRNKKICIYQNHTLGTHNFLKNKKTHLFKKDDVSLIVNYLTKFFKVSSENIPFDTIKHQFINASKYIFGDNEQSEIIFIAYYTAYLEKNIISNFNYALSLFKCLSLISPNFFFFFAPDHLFRQWSKVNSVPFICAQHGMQGVYSIAWEKHIDVSTYFAWGNLLPQIGMNTLEDTSIIYTGNPMYSSTKTSSNFSKSKKDKIILVAFAADFSIFFDGQISIWNELIQLIKENPTHEWSIKFHPKDRVKKQVFDELKALKVHFIENITSHEAIKKADLIITSISTIALDALFFEKKVVIINIFNQPEFFSSFNIGTLVDKVEEINQKISIILQEKSDAHPNDHQLEVLSKFRFNEKNIKKEINRLINAIL